jgi:hypothetical protein
MGASPTPAASPTGNTAASALDAQIAAAGYNSYESIALRVTE